MLRPASSQGPLFRKASLIPGAPALGRARTANQKAAFPSFLIATHPEIELLQSKDLTPSNRNIPSPSSSAHSSPVSFPGARSPRFARQFHAFFGTQSAEKAFAFSSPVLFSPLQLNLPGSRLSATLACLQSSPLASSKALASIPRKRNRNPFEVRHGR